MARVTQILARMSHGNAAAMDELIPLVHAELRRIASRQMRNERVGHTLQPTALVNEAYLRLAGFERMDWRSRAHFLAVASRVMRQILIDHARRRAAARRGSAAPRATLTDDMVFISGGRSDELIDLDRALRGLEAISPVQSQIVEMQYFGGMTVEEIAEVLGISPRTVKRRWAEARIWLSNELNLRTRSASSDPKRVTRAARTAEPD